MIVFLARFFFLSVFFLSSAGAEEKGYKEAREYFISIEKNKAIKVNEGLKASSRFVDGLDNKILHLSKYFMGFGAGEVFGFKHYSLELGAFFLQSKYFQQSFYLEYNRFNSRFLGADKLESIKSSYAHSFFLLHSVYLSSQLFYFSPEISAGIGHIFDSLKEGSLLTLKTGVVYSNKWTERRLFSAHFYYRRNQYFQKDYHGDGFGFSLRFEL